MHVVPSTESCKLRPVTLMWAYEGPTTVWMVNRGGDMHRLLHRSILEAEVYLEIKYIFRIFVSTLILFVLACKSGMDCQNKESSLPAVQWTFKSKLQFNQQRVVKRICFFFFNISLVSPSFLFISSSPKYVFNLSLFTQVGLTQREK